MDPDFLVIGAGVAGLRGAIELSQAGTVLVVAKDSLRESSSEYAQGGIAVALSDDDEVGLHELDTLAAGAGLCDREAVHTLVEEGPAAIEQLIEWGAEFDRDGMRLAFTREAAHSRSRILHAHGDSTGREIARTLYRKASSIPAISFRSFRATVDLLIDEGQAAGALVFDGNSGETIAVRARAVLLATGGLGRVYKETTNPDVATGDGVAMAWRAGAEIGDIEFVQFHPTALHVEGAPRFLLSEAMRGEGGLLRNTAGERFTDELAPRDVVSRAIVAEMRQTGAPHVFLDLTHRGPELIRKRFPRVHETCLRYGVDIATQPAPVHPAAHYAMGGVRSDRDGRTSLPGLYAAGEAACTGVHGANRLASNSLLEGVVFGARAGSAILADGPAQVPSIDPRVAVLRIRSIDPDAAPRSRTVLQQVMWEDVGISRSGEGLERAARAILDLERDLAQIPVSRVGLETRNLLFTGRLIAESALRRQESRGSHFRTDFPDKDQGRGRHSIISPGAPAPDLPRIDPLEVD